MKKVVVLGLTSLFLLTGCGSKVVCKGETKQSGQKVSAKYTATLKSKKVDKVKVTMKFSDKKSAEDYCGLMELAKAFAGDSAKLDFKCKGKTIEFSDYTQMSSEIKGMSKDDFIKSMEEAGLTCK